MPSAAAVANAPSAPKSITNESVVRRAPWTSRNGSVARITAATVATRRLIHRHSTHHRATISSAFTSAMSVCAMNRPRRDSSKSNLSSEMPRPRVADHSSRAVPPTAAVVIPGIVPPPSEIEVALVRSSVVYAFT